MLETHTGLEPASPAIHAITLASAAQTRTVVEESHQLWLCIHLPQFALEILTRSQPGQHACVLAEERGRKVTVMMANTRATRLGVRPGMPLAAARILGDLTVLTRDERNERQTLDRLCAWACQFSPVVSGVAPDGLLLEVKGSLKLFGGAESLLAGIRRGMRELGYKASLAIAPTPLAATVLARAEIQQVILSKAMLSGVLAPLPLETLRLEEKQLAVLESIGVRSIGDCLRLPQGGLGRRTGPELLATFQRLTGRAPDPRSRFELPRIFQSALEIPWETANAQALSAAGERLLHELVGYLRSMAARTRRLRWSLDYAAGGAVHFQLDLAQASRNYAHLALLLRERLSRTKLDGRVTGLGLYVDDIVPEQTNATTDLFTRHTTDQEEDWSGFLDRLRVRLGEQAVRGLQHVADHRPECAWRWTKPTMAKGMRKETAGLRKNGELPERPLWLMRRPLRLRLHDGALDLNGPLSLLRERERIETGWWDGKPVGRDYFVAANPSGARLWIYREIGGDRQWYLHGIFE